MKKVFIGGFILGSLFFSTISYAVNSVSVSLVPIKFIFDGKKVDLDSKYSVLNYNGHTYVPARFVVERMGGYIRYSSPDKTISINSKSVQSGRASHQSNPLAEKENEGSINTLQQFYDAFINEDFDKLINFYQLKYSKEYSLEYLQASVAQSVINDRHWYGNIDKYEIIDIKNIDSYHKEAVVLVSSHSNKINRVNTDRFNMVLEKDEWLIEAYKSGSPWPTMP